MTQSNKSYPFLPEDDWKKVGVTHGLREHLREECAKQQLKVQECVRRFIEAKENTSHNNK